MPERLAKTDPFKQIPEAIGSGPFRFVANEYVAGNLAVFAKFDRYNPRPEPASFAAGGYRVMVDRVEWRIIPDAATAANALAAGEIDWLDSPLPDLLPMLRKTSGVAVGPIDIYGTFGGLRPNQLQGPTANPGVRRAMLAAIDQVEVMTAVMGDEKSLFRAPVGYFLPGTPSANDAGMDAVRKRHSTDDIKAMLKEAGYGGERVVLMHPTDQTFYDAMSSVVAVVATTGWNQPGRTVARLGYGGAAPYQQGAAGQGRLVDLPVWCAGGGLSRPDLRRQLCAATARTPGSAGQATRRWKRCATPGWTATTKPRASVSMRKSSHVPSRPSRSFRSANTCRPPPGAATSAAC